MPDSLPFAPTAVVIAALSAAVGVLYYDNKYLVREILKALIATTEATEKTGAKIEANTASVERMTEEMRRGA